MNAMAHRLYQQSPLPDCVGSFSRVRGHVQTGSLRGRLRNATQAQAQEHAEASKQSHSVLHDASTENSLPATSSPHLARASLAVVIFQTSRRPARWEMTSCVSDHNILRVL